MHQQCVFRTPVIEVCFLLLLQYISLIYTDKRKKTEGLGVEIAGGDRCARGEHRRSPIRVVSWFTAAQRRLYKNSRNEACYGRGGYTFGSKDYPTDGDPQLKNYPIFVGIIPFCILQLHTLNEVHLCDKPICFFVGLGVHFFSIPVFG